MCVNKLKKKVIIIGILLYSLVACGGVEERELSLHPPFQISKREREREKREERERERRERERVSN